MTARGNPRSLCALLLGLAVIALPAGCGKKAAPFLSQPVAAGSLEVTDVVAAEGTLSVRFIVPGETFRLGKEEPPWSLIRLLRRKVDGGEGSYVERSVLREAEGFAFGRGRTVVDELVGEGRYLYRVELRKEEGPDRAVSEPIAFDTASHPPAVGELAIEGREGAIALSWKDPVSPAGGIFYLVHRRRKDGGESEPISREPLKVTSFTDTRISREVEYCYQVQAVIQEGVIRIEGERSRETCARSVDRTPPPAPVGLRLVFVEGAFRLSWLPVESGEPAGYHVYRSTGKGPFVKISSTLVTGTGYQDGDLEAGSEYGYRVTSVDGSSNANESAFSEVVKGVAPAR